MFDQSKFEAIKTLNHGAHRSISDGMCAMEAAAYVAGEPWSDHPECVCPVLASFMRTWNDGLPSDADRTRLLLPLVPKLIGTRSTKAVEQRRATMAADWLIRTHTVAWLRLAKLDAQADMLAELPEITDLNQCPSIQPTLNAIRKDAAAARAAAWDAAWDALRKTTEELQASAVALIERMIAVE